MKLDKNKIYDLSELTIDELEQVFNFLCTEDEDWHVLTFKNFKEGLDYARLAYVDNGWIWVYQEPTANAKELFYTLENIQVDCKNISAENIIEIKSIVENKGYSVNGGHYKEPNSKFDYFYFKLDNNINNEFYFGELVNHKTTITYEKFMEMFAPKYEDTMIAEQPKGELCDNLKPLINAVEILNELKAYKEKSEEILTLDSIQVDCSELTEGQVKEMCKVYENNGYKQWIDPEAFIIIDNFTYLRIDSGNEFYITGGLDTKHTITYEKFMELFGENEKLPPYKEVPLKWNYETLVGGNQVVIEHTKEFVPSKKQVLKYLLNRDIVLTPKQYKKLWKGL